MPDGWEILGVLAGSQLLPNSDWNQSPERVRILRAGEHLVLTLRWRCRADGAEFFLLRGQSLSLPRSVQQRPPVDGIDPVRQRLVEEFFRCRRL
ncbi:MAG: hypothetical protein U0872_12085 [Planctomycetaceae bacterium]